MTRQGDIRNLSGKRVAILAENMYQEMELWVPYYRLKEAGADGEIDCSLFLHGLVISTGNMDSRFRGNDG